MKLYFAAHTKIDPEHSDLYNHIAVKIRKPFTDLIESISRQHATSIEWWVSSPASRNPFASPLFHYCCCLALLQELIRGNKPVNEIVTDSRALKKILVNYLASQRVNARVSLMRPTVIKRLKEFMRPIYVLFGLPLQQLLLFFSARHTRPLRKEMPTDALTLIDTVIMPGYIAKDRNYPGVLEALSESEKKRVWFVPLFYGFRPWQSMAVVRRLRKSEKNFLLIDDFLKFKDYGCLLRYLFWVFKFKIKPSLFREVDLSQLVHEEMTGFRNVGSAYIPLLNYCFAKRLKQAGVKLKLVIDWFENQNIDRGWNAGFRRFFPKIRTKGYQGFMVSPHYLCMYPTKEEKKNSVIPHTIAVTGKGLVQSARRFCPDLDVCIAPAFRFQHLWRERKYWPAENVYTILVALPIVISEAAYLLKLLDRVMRDDTDTRIWIKPHPATSEVQIKTEWGHARCAQFGFVSGDFKDYVEQSNLLIMSNSSSTCMETLAKGIPVIIVGNRHGLVHNPIPDTIKEDIGRLCYSAEEIKRAIHFYKNRSLEKIEDHKKIGNEIRMAYFEPVTRKGVRRFLGIDDCENQASINN